MTRLGTKNCSQTSGSNRPLLPVLAAEDGRRTSGARSSRNPNIRFLALLVNPSHARVTSAHRAGRKRSRGRRPAQNQAKPRKNEASSWVRWQPSETAARGADNHYTRPARTVSNPPNPSRRPAHDYRLSALHTPETAQDAPGAESREPRTENNSTSGFCA